MSEGADGSNTATTTSEEHESNGETNETKKEDPTLKEALNLLSDPDMVEVEDEDMVIGGFSIDDDDEDDEDVDEKADDGVGDDGGGDDAGGDAGDAAEDVEEQKDKNDVNVEETKDDEGLGKVLADDAVEEVLLEEEEGSESLKLRRKVSLSNMMTISKLSDEIVVKGEDEGTSKEQESEKKGAEEEKSSPSLDHPLQDGYLVPSVPPTSSSASSPGTKPNDQQSNGPSASFGQAFSSLGAFASRAASSIQDAVNTASANVDRLGPTGNIPVPGGMQHQVQPTTTSPAASGTNINAQSSSHPHQNPTAHQAQKPYQQQQQQQQQQQAPADMDNAKKTAVITSAIGRLLPGERVIMFLSGLGDVADSSTPNTGVGSARTNDTGFIGGEQKEQEEQKGSLAIWCCAMTFYRVVLFSYRECDFQTVSLEGGGSKVIPKVLVENQGKEVDVQETAGESSSVARKNIGDTNDTSGTLASTTLGNEDNTEEAFLGAPSESTTFKEKNQNGDKIPKRDALSLLIQTASISRQYQLSQKNTNHATTPQHSVLQMPLASIDRVERTSEPSSSTSVGSHNSGGLPISGAMGNFAAAVGSNISQAPSALMNNGGVSGGASSLSSSPAGGAGSNLGLIILGKDNGRFLRFRTTNYGDAIRAHEALNTYAFPGRRNLGYLFAFESRRGEVMASVRPVPQGQQQKQQPQQQQQITARPTLRRYEAGVEFQRMGVLGDRTYHPSPQDTSNNANNPTVAPSPWNMANKANASYSLCPSYPSSFITPNSVDDRHPEGLRLIRKVAAFRSEGRMPVLSWGSAVDGASIWRCSQPRVGLQGNRSAADERYLRLISECALKANSQAEANGLIYGGMGGKMRPSREFLKMLTGGNNEVDLLSHSHPGRHTSNGNGRCLMKILDLRPRSSAMANRTGGYGYENTSYYSNVTISFLGIGNIHTVRDSYQKLSSICLNPNTNDVQWSQLIEESRWLQQIRLILSASWQTAFHIRYNRLPVLLHCSHGWDRTSQVSALAQLLLDPYYRTRAGFATLVEKDFMVMGHPFHTRCGHGEGRGERGGGVEGKGGGGGGGGGDEGQLAPIFIQFLDCVFQIVNQYPDYFEFNTRYLLQLSEHVYSCRFGTLLCDNEREREHVAGIRQRTFCLWEYLDSDPDLINPYYLGMSSSSSTNSLRDKLSKEESGALMMPLPTLLRNVTLWTDRHCMYGPKPTIRCIPSDLHDYVRSKEGAVVSSKAGDAQGTLQEKLSLRPLNGADEFCTALLGRAVDEASKWKAIAELREREVMDLKSALERKSHQDDM